jgi:hypothetical protein
MIPVRFLDLKFLHKLAAIMIGTSNPPHLVAMDVFAIGAAGDGS